MNDELSFQLRASWREFDVPDSEQASRLFEKHRGAASEDESLIDQAKGIVMSAYGTDGDTAGQLLMRLADSSRLRVADLARGVVKVTTAAAVLTDDRAVEVANRLMSRATRSRDDSRTMGAARSVDLRPSPAPRLSGTG